MDVENPTGGVTEQEDARFWSDPEILTWMVAYIREHVTLPSRTEYMSSQGDGPDESTIRRRLGSWKSAWQQALHLALTNTEPATDTPEPPEPADPAHVVTDELRSLVLEGLRAGLRPYELSVTLKVPRTLLVSIRDELRVTLEEPTLGQHRRTRPPPSKRTIWTAWSAATWPANTAQLTRLVYGTRPTQKERVRMRVKLSALVRSGRLLRIGHDRYDLPRKSP